MHRRPLLAFGLLLLLMIAVPACDGGPTSPSDVVGRSWNLVSVQETGSATPTVVADPSRYQLTFGDANMLTVKSDCNSCGGRYSITGSALAVTSLSCTLALCANGSLDATFTRALQQTQTVAVNDHDMTIHSAAGVLKFRD